MEHSPVNGIKGMMSDVLVFFKMTFITKKGLAVLSICTFIYLLSLFICNTTKIWSLILSLLAIITFLVLSWLIWFRATKSKPDDD